MEGSSIEMAAASPHSTRRARKAKNTRFTWFQTIYFCWEVLGGYRDAGGHRNPGLLPLHGQKARAADSCSLAPEGLTWRPSLSSLPPRTHLTMRQLLWVAGRQDFWKVPKERLHPCAPQSLTFPPSSCLNRLCQIKTSGCPPQGETLGNPAPSPAAAQVDTS